MKLFMTLSANIKVEIGHYMHHSQVICLFVKSEIIEARY